MKARRRLDLNLASRPVRNRRLYRLLRNVLVLILASAVGLGGAFAFIYARRATALSASLTTLRTRENELRAEQQRLTENIRKADKADRIAVDAVNGIIYRKSFSWVAFLSLFEAGLPDSSFITSLTLNSADGRSVGLRLQLVTQGTEDVLLFMKNMAARDFKGIRIESQSMAPGGHIISELSMTYERTL